MTVPRRARLVLRAALLLLGLVIAGPHASAEAHGALRRAEPASGARLTTAPRLLRLTFNESVELAVARLGLIDPDGRAVPLSPVRHGDSAAVVAADVAGPLRAGTYTVEWQIAGRDGHPVRGRYRFTIAAGAAGLGVPAVEAPGTAPGEGAAPEARSAATADPGTTWAGDDPGSGDSPVEGFSAESPLYAAIRWLGYAGLLALAGTAGFGLVVVPGALRRGLPSPVAPTLEARARVIGLAAAAALAVATALRLVAQSAALHGGSRALDPAFLRPMLGGTTWGAAWMLQLAAALLALGALAAARRRPARAWAVVGVAAALAGIASALSGHALAVDGLAPLAVGVHAVHALAAGGWLGTLLLLVGAGVGPARRLPAVERGPALAALVHAFSPWALACAAVVAATGAAAAWLHLGAPAALWTTTYGRTLLVKLAVLGAVAAAGAYNWRRVRPALGDGRADARLTRSAGVELAAAAVALAVTAVLVATPPDAVP